MWTQIMQVGQPQPKIFFENKGKLSTDYVQDL